jgi:uncharacterized protein with HEPN domain
MSTNPDDTRYLWHMLEHATHVQYIVLGLDPDTYAESIQVRLAAERGLDILSRAAARVSARFKVAHPEIPWLRVMAVGATLAYPEGTPDDDLVWSFLRRDLPHLMESLEPLIGTSTGVAATE